MAQTLQSCLACRLDQCPQKHLRVLGQGPTWPPAMLQGMRHPHACFLRGSHASPVNSPPGHELAVSWRDAALDAQRGRHKEPAPLRAMKGESGPYSLNLVLHSPIRPLQPWSRGGLCSCATRGEGHRAGIWSLQVPFESGRRKGGQRCWKVP